MLQNWLDHIFGQRGNEPVRFPDPPALPPPSLETALSEYQEALDALKPDEPPTFLAVLLIRDRVETFRQKETVLSPINIQSLLQMDAQLRQRMSATLSQSLANWRLSLMPPSSHWWWYLDEQLAKKEKEKDLLWGILAVTCFILTVPLATDIIRRLWVHAPDNVAIISTLLILLITASPFTQNGQELVQWLLRRFPRLPIHRHAEIMATTAFIAFMLIAGLRFLYLPRLAIIYNDLGVAAIQQGKLTIARQKLQQAVAINSDLASSYYNLAAAYETIARYDEAIKWYEQALDRDLDFAPAYNNLGRLYLEQGTPDNAQTVLLSGLAVLQNGSTPSTATEQQANLLTRYRLHTHLGQAYYEQEQFTLAAEQLVAALALETGGELESAFFAARPHFYLALTYEALHHPSAEIVAQWEAALSYLTDEDPANWQAIITEHLSTLR